MSPDRVINRTRTTIRPATTDDMDFILSLVPRLVSVALPRGRRKREVLAAVRADIERALHDAPPGEHFFIAATDRGARRGFLRLQVQRDFFSGARACHISDLAVPKRHEGHGIGRGLLEFARTWARDHRCVLLTLSVFPGNTRARGLYERSGYTPDLLRMARTLK